MLPLCMWFLSMLPPLLLPGKDVRKVPSVVVTDILVGLPVRIVPLEERGK